MKLSAALAGSFLVSEATYPLFKSFQGSRIEKPTLSPGSAIWMTSWWHSTDITSETLVVGAKFTTIPALSVPVSTLPTATVPIPLILYTSYNGSLRGLSMGLLGGSRASNISKSVGPLYHYIFSDFSRRFSPYQPEIGTKGILSGL